MRTKKKKKKKKRAAVRGREKNHPCLWIKDVFWNFQKEQKKKKKKKKKILTREGDEK